MSELGQIVSTFTQSTAVGPQDLIPVLGYTGTATPFENRVVSGLNFQLPLTRALDVVMQIAVAGTNLADAALQTAWAGTAAASASNDLADTALQTAWTGTSTANTALQTAWTGTGAAASANGLADTALETAWDGTAAAASASDLAYTALETAWAGTTSSSGTYAYITINGIHIFGGAAFPPTDADVPATPGDGDGYFSGGGLGMFYVRQNGTWNGVTSPQALY
jgi:hypothetical protein